MKAELTPLKGGPAIPITRDITLIGRQEDLCDVFIDKSSISKLHCLIVRTDGLLFIRDLGSTNGTKVNGQRVVRGALLPGDELSIASEKFRVMMGPSDAVVTQQEAHTEAIPVSQIPEDRLHLSPETPLPLNAPSLSDVRLVDEN